jgi:hypothetical protein
VNLFDLESHSMKTLKALLAALASTVVLAACGGGDDTPPASPPADGATVSGIVVSMDTDLPVAGATVTAGDKTAKTQADGRFTLAGLAASERLPVRVEAPQFGPNVAAVRLAAKGTASVRVRLLPLAAAQDFNPAADATLTSPGSAARVQLPADALVDSATGQPVPGMAKASVTPVDPARDAERMPGNYTAVDNNATVRTIESFGAIKVDLRDAAGRRLQLAPGKTATVRIPLSTRSANPPATVPLFYFQETSGHWIKEGEASLVTSAGESYYEGTVSHFSYWNADKEAETVIVEGCVVGPNGAPAAGVRVSSNGVDYSGRSDAVTDNEGRFSIAVRRDSTTGIWAATDTLITPIHEVEVGQFGGGMKGDCMKLEAATSPIPGKLSPKVMGHPKSTTVQAGDAAMLQVVAEGTQPMTYEWSRNGQAVAASNSSILWINATGPADDGAVYTVRVTNAAGTATSAPAKLTVTGSALPPSIDVSPLPLTVNAGAEAQFGILVQGSGPFAYQWRRNGADIAGATQAVYRFTTVQADDGARFSVKVTNDAASVVSEEALLTVVPAASAPVITQQPISIPARVGSAASFTVLATGSGPIAYRWQRGGVDIAGETGPVLQLDAVALADDGASFRVIVSNAHGSVTSSAATLTVTAGSEDEQARLMRLLMLWGDGMTAASAPLQFADDDFKVRAVGEVCLLGNAVLKLDNAAAPAVGQVLPLGSHVLSAQFAECQGDFGLAQNGLSSLAYQFAAVDRRAGSGLATLTNFRNDDSDLNGDPTSTLVNGQANVVLEGSLAGTQETSKVRFTPVAGLKLTDVASGVDAVFGSGNVLMHTVHTLKGAASIPVLVRQEFAQLAYTRGGVAFVLDGFLQFDFDAQGRLSSGSGSVTIRASGQAIGRISATASGYAIDVLGPVPAGVKAQASRRTQAAGLKAVAPTLPRRGF